MKCVYTKENYSDKLLTYCVSDVGGESIKFVFLG